MTDQSGIKVIDKVLEKRRESLGCDYQAYRNHACRVFHLCLMISGAGPEEAEKIAPAAAFHDLGIWTHRTFDYLGPSAGLLEEYLQGEDKTIWQEEIRAMILYHHKVTPYRGANAKLVEAFRKADWTDVTWGIISAGLPGNYIRALQRAFPNAGFHRRLSGLMGRRFLSHPWSPLPMVKW